MKRVFAVIGLSELISLLYFFISDYAGTDILVSVLLLLLLIFIRLKQKTAAGILGILLCALMVCGTALNFTNLSYRLPSQKLAGEKVQLSGSVVEKNADGTLILKQCSYNGNRLAVGVKLYSGTDSTEPIDVQINDIITAWVQFAEEEEDTTTDLFYYHGLSKHVGLTAFLLDTTLDIAKPYKLTPLGYLYAYRQSVADYIQSHMSQSAAPVTTALLTGNTDTFSSSFKAQMRVCGVSHLFAVSGMHLSLWTGLFYVFLTKRLRTRVISKVLLTAFIVTYSIFTGFSPSVIRAGIMLSVSIWAGVFRQKADCINTVGITAGIMLLFNPYLAGNVSFLLSVFAVIALFTVAPLCELRLHGWRDRKISLLQKAADVRNDLFLSFGVLLFTMPISALFFGTVSLWSPLSSLLCSLPAEGTMLFSFFGIALKSFPRACELCFEYGDKCAQLLLKVINTVSQWDCGVFTVDSKKVFIGYILAGIITLVVYYLAYCDTKSIYITLTAIFCTVSIISGIFTHITAGQMNLTVFNSENELNMLLTAEGYSHGIVISTGSIDRYYTMMTHCERKAVNKIDTFLIPKASEFTEVQLNLWAKNMPMQHLVISTSDANTYDGLSPNGIDTYRLRMWGNAVYDNLSMSESALGVLYIGDIKIVVCYYSSIDMNNVDAVFRSGDIFISKGGLPKNLQTDRFKTIVVSSTRSGETLHLPQWGMSTADYGNITVTVKKGGNRYAVD